MTHKRQLHLGAFYATGQQHTAWTLGDARDETAFDSYAHVARTAEKAHFDFFFSDNGLALRQQLDGLLEAHIPIRPEMISLMAAIASVTDKIGVIATLNTSHHLPYQLIREVSSLQFLTNGRLGWNIVTGVKRAASENFRGQPGVKDGENYERAKEVLSFARRLWDESWEARPADIAGSANWTQRAVHHQGSYFRSTAHAGTPPLVEQPVIFQAGHSDRGREAAASFADGIYTMQWELQEAQEFYRDVKQRLPKYGRAEDDLKIMSGLSVIVGDSKAEAKDRLEEYYRSAFNQQVLQELLEQVWGITFRDFDFDGPFPDIEPNLETARVTTKFGAYKESDPLRIVPYLRELQRKENISAREALIRANSRNFVYGTPGDIADFIVPWISERALDGFIVETAWLPGGLDDFAGKVVPELVDRGIFRAGYTEETLRGHLGLLPRVVDHRRSA